MTDGHRELDLVVATTATSAPIASLLVQILVDAGIPATCGTTDMDLLLDRDPIGDQFVEVLVPRSWLARAREVLVNAKAVEPDTERD